MENTKEKNIKLLQIIRMIIIGLICINGIIYMLIIFARIGRETKAKYTLNYGWELEYNSQVYYGVDLRAFSFDNVKRGDCVILRGNLPDNLTEEASLIVYLHYTDLVVNLDGERIFDVYTDKFDNRELLGNGFYEVRLGENSAGKSVEIIMRAGEDKAFTYITSPEIWSTATFRQDYAAGKMNMLALAFFFIVLGCAMAAMTIALEIKSTFSFLDSFRLVSLALFAGAFGIWIMGETNLTEIFTNDIIYKSEAKYYAFYMIPFLFAGYYFESRKNDKESKKKKFGLRNCLFGIIWLVSLFMFVFAVYQHEVNGLSMRPLLTAEHGIYGVGLVLIFVTRIYDLAKGIGKYRISNYATLLMAIAIFIDLIRYNFQYYDSFGGGGDFTMTSIYVVMVFYVLSLFFDYMSVTVSDAREEERIGIISKLAYTDALTGINNRQAAERFFDTVDASDDEYMIIQFDLNDLKKANDTYGHEEGDKYIVLFSDTLKDLFEGKGFIARTGGDEFIYVMIRKDEKDTEWLRGKLAELNEILLKKDTGHSGLKLSAAYGVYDSAEDIESSIRGALRQADSRMYEKKKEMKASR